MKKMLESASWRSRAALLVTLVLAVFGVAAVGTNNEDSNVRTSILFSFPYPGSVPTGALLDSAGYREVVFKSGIGNGGGQNGTRTASSIAVIHNPSRLLIRIAETATTSAPAANCTQVQIFGNDWQGNPKVETFANLVLATPVTTQNSFESVSTIKWTGCFTSNTGFKVSNSFLKVMETKKFALPVHIRGVADIISLCRTRAVTNLALGYADCMTKKQLNLLSYDAFSNSLNMAFTAGFGGAGNALQPGDMVKVRVRANLNP